MISPLGLGRSRAPATASHRCATARQPVRRFCVDQPSRCHRQSMHVPALPQVSQGGGRQARYRSGLLTIKSEALRNVGEKANHCDERSRAAAASGCSHAQPARLSKLKSQAMRLDMWAFTGQHARQRCRFPCQGPIVSAWFQQSVCESACRCIPSACSTSVSVSGLGTKTRWSTIRAEPQILGCRTSGDGHMIVKSAAPMFQLIKFRLAPMFCADLSVLSS